MVGFFMWNGIAQEGKKRMMVIQAATEVLHEKNIFSAVHSTLRGYALRKRALLSRGCP